MTSFLQRIKRSSKENDTKKAVSSFYITVEQYFDKYGKIRDKHTHITRYIDNDIYNLETFENAYSSILFNKEKIIKKKHISLAYSEVKKAWLDFMRTSNISINNLVSRYFNFIIDLILEKNGSFKIFLKKHAYE